MTVAVSEMEKELAPNTPESEIRQGSVGTVIYPCVEALAGHCHRLAGFHFKAVGLSTCRRSRSVRKVAARRQLKEHVESIEEALDDYRRVPHLNINENH